MSERALTRTDVQEIRDALTRADRRMYVAVCALVYANRRLPEDFDRLYAAREHIWEARRLLEPKAVKGAPE